MNSFNYPNLKYIYIFFLWGRGGGARVSECFYKGSKSKKKKKIFFFGGGGGGGGGGQVAGLV